MTPTQFVATAYPFLAFNSFAIWDVNNIANLAVININNCGMLKTHVVIVGEGGGGYQGVPQLYRNFHTVYQGGRDAWLCQAFFNDPVTTIPNRVFSGAFMTDFDKGTGRPLQDFISELQAIGFHLPAASERIIIGVGNAARDFLVANVPQINLALGINNIITRDIPHFHRTGIHRDEFIAEVRSLETEAIAAGWILT